MSRSAHPLALPQLHILTDTVVQTRFSHFELAQAAFQAGDIAVQYRNKQWNHNRDLPELIAIANLARQMGRLLIVNDDPVLAKTVGASGVHLGVGDSSVSEARTLLGNEAIIGATVHNATELAQALASSANYLGIGPVFGSQTKQTGLTALGLGGLRQLVQGSTKPVVAIGNIQLETFAEVMATGVQGIAVISAYCMSDDLPARAQQLLHALPKGK